MLKKCIGIVSYFVPEHRDERIMGITKLLRQIEGFWPDIDVLIIAQDWQDFQIPETSNNVTVINFDEPLGILGARNALFEEFLKRDYDYLIPLDDDTKIACDDPQIAADYMAIIDAHPDRFAFVRSSKRVSAYHPYRGYEFWLCALSRYIIEQEPFPQLDIRTDDGHEDTIYATLLWNKYPNLDFKLPAGIKGIQRPNVTSTYHSTALAERRTSALAQYIVQNRKLPSDLRAFINKID